MVAPPLPLIADASTRWRHARISDHIGGRKMKASRSGTARRRSLPFRESAVPGAAGKRASGELVRPRVTSLAFFLAGLRQAAALFSRVVAADD
ncbi:hypothetical protein MTO96_004251 [Rhipicephalus appendiculatus]